MPLQFEHSLMSPFFGRGIMIPFLHSFGTLPKRHPLLHSFVSCTSISSPPCFIISGHILSLPAAFPIFRFMIARCISSLLTSPLSISSSSISSKSSRSSQLVSGSSQFSTPSKCSLHLLISSSCDFAICPSVFLNEVLYPRIALSLSDTEFCILRLHCLPQDVLTFVIVALLFYLDRLISLCYLAKLYNI